MIEKEALRDAMKKAMYILIALVSIDILLLILHFYYRSDALKSFRFPYYDFGRNRLIKAYYFKITQDSGLGEMFQYLKFISAGVILLILANMMRARFLILWAALSFFLFFDDWLGIHEIIGGDVIGSTLKSSVKHSYAHGQLLYGIAFTAVVCAIGLVFWLRSSADCKALCLRLFISLGVLWFSAVVIDRVRDLVNLPYAVEVVLEEGGEHLAASFFLFFCIVWLIKNLRLKAQASNSG